MIFIISIIVFILALIGLVAAIGCYVYHDAKIRTEKPITWTLIALLVPNLLGFLTYVIVGRDKDKKSDGKYKKLAVIMAIAAFLSTVFLMCNVIFSGDLPLWDNVSIGKVDSSIGSSWNISYRTSGERLTRKLSLDNKQRESFTVSGKCESGKVYLLFIQGKTAEVFDISDAEEFKPDFSKYDDGEITAVLYNEEAREVSVEINW